MLNTQDISQGIHPVKAMCNNVRGVWIFRVDGKDYEFPSERMPFTITPSYHADKELVLKHGRA